MSAKRRETDLDRIDRPDIELGATVRASRLRFDAKPEVEVGFTGATERDSVSGSERHNLPDEVEPGTTYQDVRVRWRAAARIHQNVDDRATNRGDSDREETT
jgi:hypothetical protein